MSLFSFIQPSQLNVLSRSYVPALVIDPFGFVRLHLSPNNRINAPSRNVAFVSSAIIHPQITYEAASYHAALAAYLECPLLKSVRRL